MLLCGCCCNWHIIFRLQSISKSVAGKQRFYCDLYARMRVAQPSIFAYILVTSFTRHHKSERIRANSVSSTKPSPNTDACMQKVMHLLNHYGNKQFEAIGVQSCRWLCRWQPTHSTRTHHVPFIGDDLFVSRIQRNDGRRQQQQQQKKIAALASILEFDWIAKIDVHIFSMTFELWVTHAQTHAESAKLITINFCRSHSCSRRISLSVFWKPKSAQYDAPHANGMETAKNHVFAYKSFASTRMKWSERKKKWWMNEAVNRKNTMAQIIFFPLRSIILQKMPIDSVLMSCYANTFPRTRWLATCDANTISKSRSTHQRQLDAGEKV